MVNDLKTRLRNWTIAIRERLPGYDPVAATHLPLLRAGSVQERIAAAEALAHAGRNPAVYRALAEALADPEPFVRWQAAQTMRTAWEERRLGYLLPLLQRDAPAVVEAALWALPTPLPDQAGALVLATARHQDANVRATALTVLAGTNLPDVPELLAGGLTDSEASVRFAAVQALAQRGGTAARLMLQPLVEKWEPPFSDLVEQVLAHWADDGAEEPLSSPSAEAP